MFHGGRLVLRIYGIGLAQIAALAATLAIAREAGRRSPPPHAAQTRFLVEEIVSHTSGRDALQARLDELERRTGIEVVLDRLPDIDLAVPAESLTRRPSPWLRGLTELPVRFTPVAAL